MVASRAMAHIVVATVRSVIDHGFRIRARHLRLCSTNGSAISLLAIASSSGLPSNPGSDINDRGHAGPRPGERAARTSLLVLRSCAFAGSLDAREQLSLPISLLLSPPLADVSAAPPLGHSSSLSPDPDGRLLITCYRHLRARCIQTQPTIATGIRCRAECARRERQAIRQAQPA